MGCWCDRVQRCKQFDMYGISGMEISEAVK